MLKFEINKSYDSSIAHTQTVEAMYYQHEDGYFVFYKDGTKQVLSIRAGMVNTIDIAE